MRTRATRAEQGRAGFTLLEVMIAMAILSFGILSMTLMQLTALRQGTAGRHTTDAAAVGRTYLEQVHRLPWTTLTAIQNTGWATPAWAGVRSSVDTAVNTPQGATQIENTYTVEWQVQTIVTATCMLDVEMKVSWTEQGEIGQTKSFSLATRRYNWGGASC